MDIKFINNNLYLPIAEKRILQHVDEQLSEDELYQWLKPYEIASLLILTHIADEPKANQILEKKLADIITLANEYRDSDRLFIDDVASKINVDKIQHVLRRLDELDVFLLPEDEVAKENFLQHDGNWSFEFKAKYSHPAENKIYIYETPSGVQHAYRSEQYRILNEMLKNVSNEHLQIEAVAGSGKTMMLGSLADELLSNYNTRYQTVLALALTGNQRSAMQEVLPKAIQFQTFGNYAERLIRANYAEGTVFSQQLALRNRMAWEYALIAKEFRLQPIMSYSPYAVARIIVQMIANYCYSTDEYLSYEHIPKWVGVLKPDEQAAINVHANMLWELIINPSDNLPINFPLVDGHLVKFASLNKLLPSRHVAHIIIDESHDLSPAMLELISNGSHSITALGDKFQSVFHTPAKSKQALERTLSESYRVPKGFNNLINTLFNGHPLGGLSSFNGNRERKAKIEYYDSPNLLNLPDNTAIFVSDEWELFEFIQRLASTKREYVLIGDKRHLDKVGEFVKGCIELYSSDIPSSHIMLGRYQNWSKLAYVFRDNRAFNHILKMLRSGYSMQKWNVASSFHNPNAKIVIGLYEQARSREYPTVMLAPAVIDIYIEMMEHGGSNSKQAISVRRELSSKLYLGASRTTQKLIVPTQFEYFFKQ